MFVEGAGQFITRPYDEGNYFNFFINKVDYFLFVAVTILFLFVCRGPLLSIVLYGE